MPCISMTRVDTLSAECNLKRYIQKQLKHEGGCYIKWQHDAKKRRRKLQKRSHPAERGFNPLSPL